MSEQPMDHAAARELMEDYFAVPAGFSGEGGADALAALEAHVAGCAECAVEYRRLRSLATALQLAVGPSMATRQRVLEAVAREGRPRPAPPRAASGTPRWQGWRGLVSLPRALGAAAVVAVLAFVAGALSGAYMAPRQDDTALAKAATMMAELARDPAARTITLEDPTGRAGGTLIYQRQSSMLVVFSETLDEPASGGYGCYLERDGQRTWVGPMLFDAGTAFWAGPVREARLGRPGDRFLVLAEPTDPTPMLEASF